MLHYIFKKSDESTAIVHAVCEFLKENAIKYAFSKSSNRGEFVLSVDTDRLVVKFKGKSLFTKELNCNITRKCTRSEAVKYRASNCIKVALTIKLINTAKENANVVKNGAKTIAMTTVCMAVAMYALIAQSLNFVTKLLGDTLIALVVSLLAKAMNTMNAVNKVLNRAANYITAKVTNIKDAIASKVTTLKQAIALKLITAKHKFITSYRLTNNMLSSDMLSSDNYKLCEIMISKLNSYKVSLRTLKLIAMKCDKTVMILSGFKESSIINTYKLQKIE